MKALACVLALVAGCSSSGTPAAPHDAARDAPGDPAVCIAARDGHLDRACGSDADCVIVESADCCGPIDIAVHAGTEGSFPAVEATYVACLACAPAGCAHQIEAEDGTTASTGHAIVATCAAQRCTTVVR